MVGALFALVLNAAPITIASPEWNVVDIKPELAAFYSEQLAAALRAQGLKVTTSRDIATLLGAERQRELLGCAENSGACMAELANALGCDATLVVNLARLGDGFRGLAKVMSSRDGSVLSSVQIEASSELQLADRFVAAAKVLAAPFSSSATARPEASRPVWWVPGVAGLVVIAGGVTAFAVAGDAYRSLMMEPSERRAGDLVKRGETGQVLGWVGLGLGGAAIAASVVWLVFGAQPVKPVVSLTPGGAGLGLQGSF